jgi:hypothetical protein
VSITEGVIMFTMAWLMLTKRTFLGKCIGWCVLVQKNASTTLEMISMTIKFTSLLDTRISEEDES